jgi:hypothetical protein
VKNTEQEPSDPLAEWELHLLADEERHRRGDEGDQSGDREPRSDSPNAGSGAAAITLDSADMEEE